MVIRVVTINGMPDDVVRVNVGIYAICLWHNDGTKSMYKFDWRAFTAKGRDHGRFNENEPANSGMSNTAGKGED